MRVVEVCKAEEVLEHLDGLVKGDCDKPYARVKEGDRTLFTYYGVPAVNELFPFVEVAKSVDSGLNEEEANLVKLLKGTVKLLVTPTCPYCPKYVELFYRASLVNENLRVEVYDLTVNEELIERYHVRSTPKILYNEKPIPALDPLVVLKAMSRMTQK
ncbi:MAG: thioredoxin family protein [Thermoprotei archaeon]